MCPLLMLFALLFAAYAFGQLKAKLSVPLFPAAIAPRKWCAWLLAIGITVAACSIPDVSLQPFQFNCKVPSAKALIKLIDGSLAQYASDYDAAANAVKANPNDLSIVKNPRDSFLGTPDLHGDSAQWSNEVFAHFYGSENASVSGY